MRGVYLIGAALVSMVVSAENGSCGERLPIPVGRGAAVEYVHGDTGHAVHTGDGAFVWDAPVGDRAVVAFPLPEGERFEDYGLGKVDIEIEGGPAEVMIFIERPGEKRRIYRPIDISDPPTGARTIYFEYERPEIVRAFHETPVKPRIAFHLWSMDTGWPDQQPSRRITVTNLRLAKRRLDVVWNGFECRESTMPDGGIVIEYPIVVRNLDTVPQTVVPRLDRLEGRYGVGTVIPHRAKTAPGGSAGFTVRLELPGEARAKTGPLWCEWFLPVFSVEGVTDSDEVILRSSDAIALPLIVMPDFRGPVATLDRDGIERIRRMYATSAWAKKEGDGIIASADRALENGLSIPDGPGWTQAYYYCHEHRCPLEYKGPGRHYCPVGGEYREVDFEGVDLDRDWITGEHNRMCAASRSLAIAWALTGNAGYSEGARAILAQYRDAYFTYDWLDLDVSDETIDKGRINFAKYMETYPFRAMIEALDILEATGGVPEAESRDLRDNLIAPAIVEITDHRMDVLCRQTTITTTALLGGLFLRNPPLTAFAVRSPYGYFSLRRRGSTADGIGHGHGYAQNGYTYHLLEMAALLERCGLNTFDPELERLVEATYRWSIPMNPAPMARIFNLASRHYPDPLYRRYAGRSLIDGEPLSSPVTQDFDTLPRSVNYPHSGLSILRMPDGAGGTLDAEFKWGMPDNRGSFSVLSYALYFHGRQCQSYPGHFPWGSTDLHHQWQIQTASHTTIVVDSRNQSGMKDYFKGHYMPHPSRLLAYEETGDYAAAVARNDRIYPGVDIVRSVIALDGAFLIADMLFSDKRHTYDWWFHGVPDHTDARAGIGAVMQPRGEPLGTVDGYDMVRGLTSASVGGSLSCDWKYPDAGAVTGLSMRILNDRPLEVVHGFEWSRQYREPEKEFIVLRRENAGDTDFVALVIPRKGAESDAVVTRTAVTSADGSPVPGALGVVVELKGKRYTVTINPDRREISTPDGLTDRVLAVRCE